MSPSGAWFILYHPSRPEEPQIIQAMSIRGAEDMTVLPKDDDLEVIKTGHRPDMLEVVAHLEHDYPAVQRAIDHWPETDPSKKPASRARTCFIHAFDRSYKKWEARALSDIVRRARDIYGLPVPPGEGVDNVETQGEDQAVHGGDTSDDPGGGGDPGVRLGRVSWADKKRTQQKDKRPKTMEALGDPRDRGVSREAARGRGGYLS